MNKNKNFTLIKWILIVLISTISNAKEKPMTPIWERQVNNCKESYIFSAFSNNFVIISGTGKTLLGTYTHESVKNSDRVKLSLMVAGDNGVSDCFNNTYDSSRKTLILYSFYNIKTHMLQLSETKTGDYFGSFSEVSLLDNKTDAITFQLIFNQLLAEIKAKNEKLRRTSNQQTTNANMGLTSAQSAASHAATMGVINNMATSDHYNSSTGEYEGNW